MTKNPEFIHLLQNSLELPCGTILKNRLAKLPMSDSLGDGEGNATKAQIRLYERWAEGGAALSIVGEVQGDHRYPESTGNLVLGKFSNDASLQMLTSRARIKKSHIWAQIGHAGALSHSPISRPKGPSPLDVKGLKCSGMLINEVHELPGLYARTASHAKAVGFSGVHIHAGHGFLLSQFLSPLFNHRTDDYGGSIEARCRIVLEIIDEIRRAVGSSFPIGIRINATDQLEGGLTETDALKVVRLLDQTSIDLIDISGGTYFPGAKASSEGSSTGPYFLDFAHLARGATNIPLMLTGGIKKREQAIDAIKSGAVDMVGLARIMVLNPNLVNAWLFEKGDNSEFPRFESTPPGGMTAWYTMRLNALGNGREDSFSMDLPTAIRMYKEHDAQRRSKWQKRFAQTD